MEALKRKWNSDRGASILLAMLFLLVCMMVGASVVMAAASNAGKYDSNKTEQQKYLDVSSAMTMLVEELKSVTYVGNYSYKRTEVWREEEKLLADEDGNPVLDENGYPKTEIVLVFDHYVHTYIQGNVTVTGSSWLDDVLPLREHFDYVFDRQFEVPGDERTAGDGYIFKSLTEQAEDSDSGVTAPTDPGSSYTLTFTGPEGYGDLNEQVTVEVKLRADGSILLTATTKDETGATDFTMMALLELDPATDAAGNPLAPEKLLVLPNEPTGGSSYKTTEIKWKLKHIFKREATGG